jgi:hypothetical protein
MNAKELRIGNYYDHNGEIKTVTPNTILEVWEAKRNWCKAIPITEEWLLRFGFTFGIKLQDFVKGKYQFIQLKNNILYGEFSEEGIFYFNTKTKLQHVHQLQNLYFALTGKELVVSNIVNETLQQNTVSSLNCPNCNGDSWMQNLIQSEKKYCKCGAIF